MNIKEILDFIKEYLQKYSFSQPRLQAEKLLSHVLGIERIGLYVMFDKKITEKESQTIKKYLKEMVRNNMNIDEIFEIKEIDDKNHTKENKFIFDSSIKYLKEHNILNPRTDVEFMFSEILGINRSMISLTLKKELTKENKDRLKEMLVLRGKNYPLQYIFGEWEFYGYPFKVDERVLIPRPDTEILVEQVKFLASEIEKPKILDIGTGSGAIAITLGKELINSNVLGIDISSGALEVAKNNAILNEAENVKFLESDLFKVLDDEKYKNFKFDIIVSNPPYIPVDEYKELMPEVLNYEPKNALTDNGDGYYFYKSISKEAGNHLKDGGYLAFEVGYNQALRVSEFLRENKFDVVGIIKDYGNIERVVIGKKRKEK